LLQLILTSYPYFVHTPESVIYKKRIFRGGKIPDKDKTILRGINSPFYIYSHPPPLRKLKREQSPLFENPPFPFVRIIITGSQRGASPLLNKTLPPLLDRRGGLRGMGMNKKSLSLITPVVDNTATMSTIKCGGCL